MKNPIHMPLRFAHEGVKFAEQFEGYCLRAFAAPGKTWVDILNTLVRRDHLADRVGMDVEENRSVDYSWPVKP